MIHRPWPILAAFALVAGSLLAGCSEKPPPPDVELRARGTNGWFTPGWAYGGANVTKFDGTATVNAFDASNLGSFLARGKTKELTGKGKDQDWNIQFAQFSEAANKTYQSGGIAANLDEHGTTGVGDTNIPKVHAAFAGWGEATVTVDGTNFVDLVGNSSTWMAHFMVLDTAVRDDASHAVQTQDRKGIYNPANAGDGYADAEKKEIHLVLRPHVAPDSAGLPFNGTSPLINNPNYIALTRLGNTSYFGSRASITVELTGTPTLEATQLTFVVKDGGTGSFGSVTLGGTTDAKATQTWEVPLGRVGAYFLDVRGRAVASQYTVKGNLVPPEGGIYNFWWDNVLTGSDVAADPDA